MSELTDRLKQIADARPGDPMPECLRGTTGTFDPIAGNSEVLVGLGSSDNWGVALSKLCAEALAEIERLQFQVQGMVQVTDIYIYRDTIANHRCAGLTEVTQPAEPTPPWGSTFVMNPENWK